MKKINSSHNELIQAKMEEIMGKIEKLEKELGKVVKYLLVSDTQDKEIYRVKINHPIAICNDWLCIQVSKKKKVI